MQQQQLLQQQQQQQQQKHQKSSQTVALCAGYTVFDYREFCENHRRLVLAKTDVGNTLELIAGWGYNLKA